MGNSHCTVKESIYMSKPYRSIWISGVVLSMMLTGCSAAPAAVHPANTVSLIQVKETPLTTIYDLSGTLQARTSSPVSFEMGGTVDSLGVDIGATVSQGTILARLDTDDLDLKVAEAQQAVQQAAAGQSSATASLSNARAVRTAAEASVAAAQAQVEGARSKQQGVLDGARSQQKAQARNAVSKAQAAYNQAQSAAKRAEALYQNGLLSQQENEQAQTALSNAEAALNDAKEQLSLTLEGASTSDRASAAAAVKQAQVGIESARASVSQAEAGIQQAEAGVEQAQASYDQAMVALDQARLARSKSILKSPLSGVVLDKTISAGQVAGAGTSAFTVGEIDHLKVLLPVPDSEIGQWKKGQQVSITLYDEQRTGTITTIYPKTNDNTGSISVEVQIANPKHDWKPGQVVKASRQIGAKKGIMVPIAAVISTDDAPYVFRNINSKAVRTPVQTGSLYNNQLVITSGLKPGDQIVTSGADRLFDGDPIQGQNQSSAQGAGQQ